MRDLFRSWITNLRLSWQIFKALRCLWSTMGNSWGCDALLTPECGDAMGHWGLPLPGRWSCREQHVKHAFRSNSISSSLPSLSSLSSTACDESIVIPLKVWFSRNYLEKGRGGRGKTQRLVLANQPSPTSGFIGCFCARSEVLSQSRWNWVNHEPVSWSSKLFSIWILCILENMAPLKNEIIAPLYIFSKAWLLQLCWKWEFGTNSQKSQNHYRIYYLPNPDQPEIQCAHVRQMWRSVCISGQIQATFFILTVSINYIPHVFFRRQQKTWSNSGST